jgi:hypothetical protein
MPQFFAHIFNSNLHFFITFYIFLFFFIDVSNAKKFWLKIVNVFLIVVKYGVKIIIFNLKPVQDVKKVLPQTNG